MSTSVSSTDQLLTAEQLAERWQMVGKKKPGQAIYRMVREGQIPPGVYVRMGRSVRFKLPAVEAFEDAGGTDGDGGPA